MLLIQTQPENNIETHACNILEGEGMYIPMRAQSLMQNTGAIGEIDALGYLNGRTVLTEIKTCRDETINKITSVDRFVVRTMQARVQLLKMARNLASIGIYNADVYHVFTSFTFEGLYLWCSQSYDKAGTRLEKPVLGWEYAIEHHGKLRNKYTAEQFYSSEVGCRLKTAIEHAQIKMHGCIAGYQKTFNQLQKKI